MAPEYMTLPLEEQDGAIDAERALDAVLDLQADVIAVGPGFGTGPAQQAFVFGLLARSGVPLVLDADALNICAEEPDRLRGRDGLEIAITPHPGEMARLTGLSTDDVQQERVETARKFATERGVYVVLKGHRTLVATPDGRVASTAPAIPAWPRAAPATCSPASSPPGWRSCSIRRRPVVPASTCTGAPATSPAPTSVSPPSPPRDVVDHLGRAWQDTLGVRKSVDESDD